MFLAGVDVAGTLSTPAPFSDHGLQVSIGEWPVFIDIFEKDWSPSKGELECELVDAELKLCLYSGICSDIDSGRLLGSWEKLAEVGENASWAERLEPDRGVGDAIAEIYWELFVEVYVIEGAGKDGWGSGCETLLCDGWGYESVRLVGEVERALLRYTGGFCLEDETYALVAGPVDEG